MARYPVTVALLASLAATAAFAGGKLQVTQATWKPERSELRIEGTSARPDDVVLVKDAETKAFLGSAAVRADGKWLLRVKDPRRVPSRLLAACGKESTDCAVEMASNP